MLVSRIQNIYRTDIDLWAFIFSRSLIGRWLARPKVTELVATLACDLRMKRDNRQHETGIIYRTNTDSAPADTTVLFNLLHEVDRRTVERNK